MIDPEPRALTFFSHDELIPAQRLHHVLRPRSPYFNVNLFSTALPAVKMQLVDFEAASLRRATNAFGCSKTTEQTRPSSELVHKIKESQR